MFISLTTHKRSLSLAHSCQLNVCLLSVGSVDGRKHQQPSSKDETRSAETDQRR